MEWEPRIFGSDGARNIDRRIQMAQLKKISTTDVIDDDVAERIKDSMESAGLNARDIGKAVGVGEKVVYGWARLGQISKHKLPAFCKLVGVDEGWLLTGRGSTLYEKVDDDSIVEFKRRLDPGLIDGHAIHVRECRVLESADIHRCLPENNIKDATFEGLHKVILDDWTKNTSTYTSAPIPMLDPDQPGLPVFVQQFLTRDHEPAISQGSIVGYAIDIVPQTGDFCIIAKRPSGGVWTVGVGFFHMDPPVMIADQDEFFSTLNTIDTGVHLALTKCPDDTLEGAFIIDCFDDEWILIGVAVHRSEWMNQSLLFSQTKFKERIDVRFKKRERTP